MESLSGVMTAAEVGEHAFEHFYAREFDRVFDSAYSFCGDRQAALDATQEGFARAFARWRRLSRHDWAGAWVTSTTLNVLRKTFREASRQQPAATDAVTTDPTHDVDVLAALRSLSPRQRQAATLYYVADQSVAAVAEAMGLTEGAVKSHLSRARERMRRRLEDPE